ncbi:MAG: acyltransferase domain-containing protein, partial [Planctomycetales bacterium]|nr:acyltransferase domain-containing protein [Planctomycetales bacterium]
MGCRLPQANNPEAFWKFLCDGGDAVGEIPPSRWDVNTYYVDDQADGFANGNRMYTRHMAALDQVDHFDPQFFGISPREAASMDPQQRLLLEVAFRALEDAGQPLAQVAAQDVAVFVGISSFDYAVAALSTQDRGVIDAYSNTGGSASIAANRLSYCFDLRGPNVAVDTACSSSLVAVHLACESLWRGEATMALAGGVNALLLPDFYVAFSQLGVLSPDGRCKSFDARANGYVRSEGAGMALLKPLSAALRDQDAIYAVIRGTALNQDGRTPGMTVPSQQAQEQLIAAACRRAQVNPADIQYVEAHGTGTAVGDPIEARALGAALCVGRNRQHPCRLGSVKTNIGHLEAGAGIASLIKVALALHHRRIPAHLHFHDPNPAIDFSSLQLRIPTSCENWETRGSRLAGINGFGYGGANAHVILEQAPPRARSLPQSPRGHAAPPRERRAPPPRPAQNTATNHQPAQALHGNGRWANGKQTNGEPSAGKPSAGKPSAGKRANVRPRNGQVTQGAAAPRPGTLQQSQAAAASKPSSPLAILPLSAPVLLPLSARSLSALRKVAQQWAEWLESQGQEVSLAEVAGYLAHRRDHYDCRRALCATNREELIAQLRALAETPEPDLHSACDAGQLSAGIAYVCSGQGPQWWAMGRGLLTYSPVFRAVIHRCDTEFSRYGAWSLLQELMRSETTSRLQETSIAQPSLFALQVALAAVWESWGVRPTIVVGHSVGEIAAAYLSGALSFEDACRVAFYRGQTMDLASSQGAMLAAGLVADEVPAWLAGDEHLISLAAINGPSSVTLSGESQAIARLATRLERDGVFCRRLAVEYAFHSPQMEPVRAALLQALADIQPRTTHTDMISTVTGQAIQGSDINAEYWWKNVRNSVHFSQAMSVVAERDVSRVIELGPHPVLAYAIHECFQAAARSVHCLPSLNRRQNDLRCISESLGRLYSLGYDPQWSGFYRRPARKITVPSYPFQSQRCWTESLESRRSRLAPEVHPLLGSAVVGQSAQWQQRIDLKLQAYLADHTLRGTCVYPAAAIVETALAAASAALTVEQVRLQRIRIHQPCSLAADRPQWMRTTYDTSRRQLNLDVRGIEEVDTSPLATVAVSTAPLPDQVETLPSHGLRLAEIRNRCTESFDSQRLYAHCRHIGLHYGPAFQGIVSGMRRSGEALVEVTLPEAAAEEGLSAQAYRLHPALLDSCFQAMIAADPDF